MGYILDISHHQKTIDFSKLKGKVDLIIIRVQYGSKVIDDRYKEYVAGCKENGIPFGHYAYARFVSITDAEQEARDFLDRADPEAKFLVADVEEVTTHDPKDLPLATQRFIDVCKQAGWKTGLYSGDYFYTDNGLKVVKADFLWLARYGANDNGSSQNIPTPENKCDLWQYSSKGHLDGMPSGEIDLNLLMESHGLEYYLTKTEVKPDETAPKVIGVATVVCAGLYLRKGADTSYEAIRVLNHGERYKVFEVTNDGWFNLGADQWAYGGNGKFMSLQKN